MSDLIDKFCEPCEVVERWTPEPVPEQFCEPCEAPPVVRPPRKRITFEQLEIDCFKNMLINMTSQYYCGEGPKAC